jgi:cyclophilin family peptidyl-prolyl cis-trans isomerase/Flp pilus assembly protein TadD
MLSRFACLVLTALLTLHVCSMAMAEDEPAATAKVSPAEAFAKVHAEWKQINQQLDDLLKRYRAAATQAERDPLFKEYETLVEAAKKLLPQLKDAAVAAYQDAPNKDDEVTRVLVGLVANDVRRDEYDEALQTAQLLLDNATTEKAIYDLAGTAAYCRDDFASAEKYLKQAEEAKLLSSAGSNCLSDLGGAKELWTKEQELRKAEAAADDLPRVKLETSKGVIVIELFENEAPQTVGNFINLVDSKFYDGLTFHRVLSGFMAQGGCPEGSGAGGPGYEIFCECAKEDHRNHFSGTLSMAHAGKDTGGSQFFITFRRTAHLDGRHTAFGRVIEGLDVLAQLQRRDPSDRGKLPDPDTIVKATVVRKRDHKYEPTKVK